MYKTYPLLLLFLFFSMNAQIHEIGVFAGGSNYIGDIGPTTYISPNQPALGLLYKWNKNPRLSYRFSLTGGLISSFDADSKEPGRNQRGIGFKNSIKEVSLGLEFNFFDFNLHDSKRKYSPYVSSGLTVFRHHELHFQTNQNSVDKMVSSLGIPIILGFKSNITPRFVLGMEVGARYTFTDNLDGSNPKDESYTKFGNINNNDWFVFSGITLTYTFGNKPCYCAQ